MTTKTNKANTANTTTNTNTATPNTNTNSLNLTAMVAAQGTTARTTDWLTYNSKKQLFVAETTCEKLTANNANIISTLKQLRNVIAIAVNKNYNTIILTMYYSNTKTTNFLVVDVKTLNAAQFSTIKAAKASIK